MSKKPHLFVEFLSVVSTCIFALASCGGSSSWPKQEYAPPQPDASIVYVYITPDAAPPVATTCACVCADPCACSCDCGTGEPVAVQMPGCTPPVNVDAAQPTPQKDAAPPVPDAPIVPTVVDAAAPDALAVLKDASALPNDIAASDVSITQDAGKTDGQMIIDVPSLIVEPQRPDAAAPDAPAIADADRSDVPAVTTADSAPDTAPKPPTPCATTACLCPANSACDKTTALMSVDHLTDYSTLGYSGYFNSQAGFGLYTQETANSTWNIPSILASRGAAPEYELDATYTFTQVRLETWKTDGTYNTPFYNWFSLRQQMTAQMDACECVGISLEVKGDISKPRPEAGLRLTLADIVCKDSNGAPLPSPNVLKDEIWWYDIPQAQVGAAWKTINIPVNSFRLAGVRVNDQMLDLGCIQAFEISYQFNVALNCGGGCVENDIMSGSGHFEIRNLTTY